MEWITAHADTVLIIFTMISSLIGMVMWLNGKFNSIEKDIAVIKTVLMCRGIYPTNLDKEAK